MSAPPQTPQEWALALFGRSVLKQEKFRQVRELAGDYAGLTCLDLGPDNGVISLLLRQEGGRWHSADLGEEQTASIRSLVGERVHQLDGGPTEFADGYFDLVAVVDFLEHIPDDRGFVTELGRIVRPGGVLLVNVPHLRPGNWLLSLRDRLGLTDAWHGHLRPGYDRAGLEKLLAPWFQIEKSREYSKVLAESIDTALNFMYMKAQGKTRGRTSGQKGVVVTQAAYERHAKQLKLLRLIYPFLWLAARLDRLLFFARGYKLIVKARRVANR
ncbi:MAG: class I SAM-dependent methyltransferase [Deltaproteobacteria bacterium]|nr:class I SAM-dependent methyltransferase [Deltaproteobacteria bacterium]